MIGHKTKPIKQASNQPCLYHINHFQKFVGLTYLSISQQNQESRNDGAKGNPRRMFPALHRIVVEGDRKVH